MNALALGHTRTTIKGKVERELVLSAAHDHLRALGFSTTSFNLLHSTIYHQQLQRTKAVALKRDRKRNWHLYNSSICDLDAYQPHSPS